VLDRDSWNVPDEAFKVALTEDAIGVGLGRLDVSVKLATYAQLFRADSVSIAALRDLESWFRSDSTTREPRAGTTRWRLRWAPLMRETYPPS
jgi:hypothetical protein